MSSAAARRQPIASAAASPAFGRSAAYYDVLYGDKDYPAEAAYVARTIRAACPSARSILEFGAGTGRHGRVLAAMGFEVTGIERSAEMVACARAATEGSSSFACVPGDVRAARLGRSFDAVIALFNVVGYQATNDELLATFATAAAHLEPGGVFVFDVWHGPAVLAQRPAERSRSVEDRRRRLLRTARPTLDDARGTVSVDYRFECEDRVTRAIECFAELHVVRYLFPTEVDLLARCTGFVPARSEEWRTGEPPSASTWNVLYVLRK
jgi:SAM-dependent methyltransferase